MVKGREKMGEEVRAVRERVKRRDEKQATGREKRKREGHAGRRTGRWTAGDEDNVGQTKRRRDECKTRRAWLRRPAGMQ